jgi:hypothetical protein
MTEIGRLALSVLDGGVLASARLVELAVQVSKLADHVAVVPDGTVGGPGRSEEGCGRPAVHAKVAAARK